VQSEVNDILGEDNGFPGGECPGGIPGEQCGPF
jgi:hypothetical protein